MASQNNSTEVAFHTNDLSNLSLNVNFSKQYTVSVEFNKNQTSLRLIYITCMKPEAKREFKLLRNYTVKR